MENRINELKDCIKYIEENTDLNLSIKGQCLSDMRDIVEDLIFDNDRKQEGYYISINDIGPDDNFTRFYLVLGRMNYAEAIHINKNNADDNAYSAGYNDGVREVSEEEYYLWHALACYSEMLGLSKMFGLPKEMKMSLGLSEIEIEPIKQRISELRKQLGLNYHWQVVRLYRR